MKPHLFLLIDGDQAKPQAIPALLEDLEQDYTVTGRVCVRNWRAGTIPEWTEAATRCGLDCVHHEKVRSSKNGVDIELVIRAVDVLRDGHTNLCIVSRDSDFLPLQRRVLRAGGLFLWRDPLTGEPDRVHEPSAAEAAPTAPPEAPGGTDGSMDLDWREHVRDAYRGCCARGHADGDGFVTMAVLGQSLKGWRQLLKVGTSVQLRHRLEGIEGIEVRPRDKGVYVMRVTGARRPSRVMIGQKPVQGG